MKQEIFAKFSYDDLNDFTFNIKGPKITKNQVKECVKRYFTENVAKKILSSKEWEDCDDEDLNAYGDNYMCGSYGPLTIWIEIMNVFDA
jgi:hypothetical protein